MLILKFPSRKFKNGTFKDELNTNQIKTIWDETRIQLKRRKIYKRSSCEETEKNSIAEGSNKEIRWVCIYNCESTETQ